MYGTLCAYHAEAVTTIAATDITAVRCRTREHSTRPLFFIFMYFFIIKSIITKNHRDHKKYNKAANIYRLQCIEGHTTDTCDIYTVSTQCEWKV